MTDYLARLQNLSDQKLIDVVKNYRQYGYDEKMRTSAISILDTRGISKDQLELTGNYENKTYNYAGGLYDAYNRNSKTAFVLYFVILINNILVPVLEPNASPLFYILLIANFLIVCGYFLFLTRSFLNQDRFYKAINRDYGTEGALMYFFLGIPLYFLMFFYFRNQMKERMREIE